MGNKEVIIRLSVLVLTLVNLILTALGKNPLPISCDDAFVIASSVAASAAAIWTAWKNNSVTTAAKTGDKLVAAIKASKITAEEAVKLLEALETIEK